MSFDEFQTATSRGKSKELLKSGDMLKGNVKKRKNVVKSSSKQSTAPPPQKSTFQHLGDFLETTTMQFFVISMIFLDTFSAFLGMFFCCNKDFFEESTRLLIQTILRRICGFCTFAFAIEILLVLLTFQTSTIGHLGYFSDICVVAIQLYTEMYQGKGEARCGDIAVIANPKSLKNSSFPERFLNIFRLWRVARLFHVLITVERDLHTTTKTRLEEKIVELQKCEVDVKRLENDVTKERDARSSVESMLQGYKEEVDTLNEALKIAAMDIAEVAQADDDYLLSDDEGEDEDAMGDVYMDAASNEQERSNSKDVLYRTVRRAVVESAKGAGGSQSPRQSQGVTFLVNEDGSFESR